MYAGHLRRARISALLWMVVGSAAVFSTVVLMNRFAGDTPEKSERTAKSMQVAPIPEPPPKKIEQKPEPKPRPKPQTPRAPLPGIGTDIVGLDLGVEGFDVGALEELNQDVLGEQRDVVMTDDLVDVAPRPQRRVAMKYPAEARRDGVTGYVVLNLLIDATGKVQKVRVLESEPAGVFDEVARQGVRRWHFEPARYKGETVRVWAKQSIRFDLS